MFTTFFRYRSKNFCTFKSFSGKQCIISRTYSEIKYDSMTSLEMYQDLIKEFSVNRKYYLFLDE